MKKRIELLWEAEHIQGNIEQVDRAVNDKIDNNPYYKWFATTQKWNHRQEIKKKALAYWKRRFNRVLNELKYK